MKSLKRKYVMSLVVDLVLLLVGSGMLYTTSTAVLQSNTFNNLLYVILISLVLGAVLLDIVYEYLMYEKVKSMLKKAQDIYESNQDE
jgi:divalent metal cation (Fe/Co/Zn/Cd) transporter